MVLLKAVAIGYVAAFNLLGVDAGLCRPSTRTSLTSSGSETQTLIPIVSTSTLDTSIIPSETTTSKDRTSSVFGTPSNSETTGIPTFSTSETLSYLTSSGIPTSSDEIATSSGTATSGNPTASEDSTTSGNPTTSGETTSTDVTTSGTFTSSLDTTTSNNPTVSSDTMTSIETSTDMESSTIADITATTDATTTADTTVTTDTTATTDATTTAETTTTADATTSTDPTTTTSVCIEPTNMLRQPGFEPSDNDGAWGFYWGGGGVEVDSEAARTGDGLAVLPVPGGQERRMEQRVHIVPGTEYSIRFYYALSSTPPANTQCTLFATFDYYTTLTQISLPSDTEYHLYSASFISADNLDPAVEIGVSCTQQNNGYTATVFIDDASVLDVTNACDDATPVDPDAPAKSTLLIPARPEQPRCPVNAAQVPGFEPVNGEQGWVFFNRGEFVNDVSNARTGEWEALLPSGTMINGVNDGTYLEQLFNPADLTQGETYDFHFFWKPSTLPDNGKCYIFGGYNDAVRYSNAEVKAGATSSTGYTIYSVRFVMPATDDFFLQIAFYCDYNDGNEQLGSVYVDDTALIQVGGCEAFPVTGALIENPSFEIRTTEDSTYAWFGNNGMVIRASGAADEPSANSGDNYLYVQLESTKRSATLTKPLAASLITGQAYSLQFSWTAGSAYEPSDCSFTIAFGSTTETIPLYREITSYSYEAFEYGFVPAEEATSMSVTVSCSTASPDFLFDDFSLQ
ncbi:hypothetical protein FPOA_11727 [Fusarium poae]|uniref:CBM-cenC domain-containing protein n=1 Tax=Fusarium poae TaxID=36050 RepID=A0A1B8AHJ9_FUSPO|nr:hypothetical protein FPOA_11727 [Fusarium poae]